MARLSWQAVAVVWVLLVVVLSFVDGYPEADFVVKLPGQPTVTFRQYAGYVDIDKVVGRSLFYYFVEAEKRPDTKPLTLWLNGASDMLVFLLRWFDKFPELKSRDLFLTGESYAGHYIPQLADAILSYNSHSSGFKFNIKGIAIGNPLLKLDRDILAVYEFFWSHGMISDIVGRKIRSQCDFSHYTYAFPHNVSDACNDATTEAGIIITEYVNNFDVLLDICYPSIVLQELRLKQMATKMSMGVDVCLTYERQFFFNLPEVQMALHANRTHLPYEWSLCSNLLNYSGIDINTNMLPTLKRIIQNKIPVWIFSGDQDSVVPFLGTRTVVQELADDLNFKTTVPYGVWFHKRQVGGWAIEYGNLLTFATVRGAAHAVAYKQPSRALHLFSTFVRGQRLPNKTDIGFHD